eukprot:gnl/Chilomastix_cuspidata/2819.p1 GENE.gnl/Chilomastix_cuspidata/2819~~gnl/Chilomastix_cuspidata/2819.p1  ORF type:complete len:1063 (+),score=259.97 gnl/Chilomastix_cuspidata/2819:26-3214(+)
MAVEEHSAFANTLRRLLGSDGFSAETCTPSMFCNKIAEIIADYVFDRLHTDFFKTLVDVMESSSEEIILHFAAGFWLFGERELAHNTSLGPSTLSKLKAIGAHFCEHLSGFWNTYTFVYNPSINMPATAAINQFKRAQLQETLSLGLTDSFQTSPSIFAQLSDADACVGVSGLNPLLAALLGVQVSPGVVLRAASILNHLKRAPGPLNISGFSEDDFATALESVISVSAEDVVSLFRTSPRVMQFFSSHAPARPYCWCEGVAAAAAELTRLPWPLGAQTLPTHFAQHLLEKKSAHVLWTHMTDTALPNEKRWHTLRHVLIPFTEDRRHLSEDALRTLGPYAAFCNADNVDLHALFAAVEAPLLAIGVSCLLFRAEQFLDPVWAALEHRTWQQRAAVYLEAEKILRGLGASPVSQVSNFAFSLLRNSLQRLTATDKMECLAPAFHCAPLRICRAFVEWVASAPRKLFIPAHTLFEALHPLARDVIIFATAEYLGGWPSSRAPPPSTLAMSEFAMFFAPVVARWREQDLSAVFAAIHAGLGGRPHLSFLLADMLVAETELMRVRDTNEHPRDEFIRSVRKWLGHGDFAPFASLTEKGVDVLEAPRAVQFLEETPEIFCTLCDASVTSSDASDALLILVRLFHMKHAAGSAPAIQFYRTVIHTALAQHSDGLALPVVLRACQPAFAARALVPDTASERISFDEFMDIVSATELAQFPEFSFLFFSTHVGWASGVRQPALPAADSAGVGAARAASEQHELQEESQRFFGSLADFPTDPPFAPRAFARWFGTRILCPTVAAGTLETAVYAGWFLGAVCPVLYGARAWFTEFLTHAAAFAAFGAIMGSRESGTNAGVFLSVLLDALGRPDAVPPPADAAALRRLLVAWALSFAMEGLESTNAIAQVLYMLGEMTEFLPLAPRSCRAFIERAAPLLEGEDALPRNSPGRARLLSILKHIRAAAPAPVEAPALETERELPPAAAPVAAEEPAAEFAEEPAPEATSEPEAVLEAAPEEAALEKTTPKEAASETAAMGEGEGGAAPKAAVAAAGEEHAEIAQAPPSKRAPVE